MPKVVVDGIIYVPAPEQSEKTDLLDVVFFCRDLKTNITVRGFFHKLLDTLWIEEEDFSGKRPFGNSNWKADIERLLINRRAVEGSIDENGYIEKIDQQASDKLVRGLIASMCADRP